MNYRNRIGGHWEKLGELQLSLLLSAGMKPEHKLLDVGCGCFRGGVKFVAYLDDGNYVGIDRDEGVVEAGLKVEIPNAGLGARTVTTVINDEFRLDGYAGAFDYAIAQSVFPHLSRDEIRACIASVLRALKPGGRFYASYFPAPGAQHESRIAHAGGAVTNLSSNPYHQELAFFEAIASELGVEFVCIGDWGHPRSQQLLEFTKQDGRLRE